MRVITANVNGVRAAARRGGLGWLAAQEADVLCLQEVRATDAHLAQALGDAGLGAWHVAHTEAADKGRAGVAVVSRQAPSRVQVGVGAQEFATCGRWVEIDLPTAAGPVTIVSAYVHTGEADTARQEEKYRFLDAMNERLAEWSAAGGLALVTGDLNVAHREDDLKNWKGNLKRAGFLPAGARLVRPLVRVRRLGGHPPRAARARARGPTPGGRGGGRRSTTTPAGASTTSSRPGPSPSAPSRPRSAAPRPTTSGGATTPRSRSTTTSAPEALTATAHSTLTYCPRTAHSPAASPSLLTGRRPRRCDGEARRRAETPVREGFLDRGDRQRGPIERHQRDRRAAEAAAGHPCPEGAGAPCRLDGDVELGARRPRSRRAARRARRRRAGPTSARSSPASGRPTASGPARSR